MNRFKVVFIAMALMALALPALVACGGETATPTPVPTATAVPPPPTPTAVQARDGVALKAILRRHLAHSCQGVLAYLKRVQESNGSEAKKR